MKSRQHFTIVELLIVAAVMVILFSLLQPSLSHFFEKSRLVQCSANLKTQSIAVHYYQEDHVYYPYGHDWFGGRYDWEPNRRLHRSKSWEYVQDEKPYICETFRMLNDALPGRNKVASFSYGFNWYVSRTQNTIHSFKKPSSMAMITEENPYLINNLYRHTFNDGFILLGPRNPTYIDGIATFHNAGSYSSGMPADGFANVLWLDGHVSLGDINYINDVMRDE